MKISIPYVRRRLITEQEVVTEVLKQHSAGAAEKFIQEVFWRSYWKGWLELRPTVWHGYQTGLRWALNAVQTQDGLERNWRSACTGNTGIDCFDAWAEELTSTGYLHNHARMWFASIWIFTLRLPWELGADFFLRNLLDGDPASNTWDGVGLRAYKPSEKPILPVPKTLKNIPMAGFHQQGWRPKRPRSRALKTRPVGRLHTPIRSIRRSPQGF